MTPLRLGMVGGGSGAFIGAVHRMAAALDGQWVLTAGALSSTPERSLASARALGLAPDRSYASWPEMLRIESTRPAHERIDAVAIVTPNATHFEIARAFALGGFNIICDKPMVVTTAQAAELADTVERAGIVFAVTYNYTGYPMVRQAAAMIREGRLGEIRKVFVEYHQGWLASPIERDGQKQAAWRLDPSQAGAGGAIGDIGTHAENLMSYVTGLEIESLCADLSSLVPGRTLDDDAAVLLRFTSGARGVLTVSQVCIGEQNNLTLRVHGTRGSLAWRQEQPNTLIHDSSSGVRNINVRAGAGLHARATAATRLPPGHPEGFIEAFANIYRDVATTINATRPGWTKPEYALPPEFPTLADGARGTRFIERVIASARADSRWVTF